jgi:hypothetical protein
VARIGELEHEDLVFVNGRFRPDNSAVSSRFFLINLQAELMTNNGLRVSLAIDAGRDFR